MNLHRINRFFRLSAALSAGVFLAGEAVGAVPESFSWGGVDGLGRTLTATPPKKPYQKERCVAIFYWPWHYSVAGGIPYNNSEILAKFPDAVNNVNHKAWTNMPLEADGAFFWGKPLFGYYTNLDSWVVAKHAIMLADAGVDVIVFDATNGTSTWMPAVEALCQTFQKLQHQGVNVPKIAFMLNFAPNANTKTELRQLYNDFYSRGRFRDLWFMWKGKPLIMAHPEALSVKDKVEAQILRFFTFRRNEPGYFTKDTPATAERWGWCSTYPQTRFGYNLKNPMLAEEMAVSVAQNATAHRLCAMNDPRGGVFGRGFAKGDYQAVFPMWNGKPMSVSMATPDAWQWGLNFQQQFDYAIDVDPELVFVTGWNEWIASRYKVWQGTPNAFPDEFSPEFSRDIEPAENAPYDNFYCQLVYNVRRYKGSAELPPPVTMASKPLTDDFSNWNEIQPLFSDPRDSFMRNSAGWKTTYYRVGFPLNDIVAAKASFDRTNLYFYLECDKVIRQKTRLRLLLATGGAGWEGFDFVVQSEARDGKFSLMRLMPGKAFKTEKIADVASVWKGNAMVFTVPLKALGLNADFKNPIQFKWSDEQSLEKSVLTFYTEGECAPNGRFRYILIPESR